MLRTRAFSLLAACSLLGLSHVAHAGTVVLTPLLGTRGVSENQIDDIFTLMSSELEFMEGIDQVVEVLVPPPALTTSCLESTRCLAAVTREHRGDLLITGTVGASGGELVVDLLLYDTKANRVVRRKTHNVPTDASALIDRMTPILVETLTGERPGADEARMDALSFDQGAGADDFFVDDPAPVTAPPPTTGTTRAVGRTITPPPQPEPEPAFDPSAFDFASDASDIQFGAPAADEIVLPEEAPPPRRPPVREAREVYDPYDPAFVEAPEFDEGPGFDVPRRSRSTGSSAAPADTKGVTGFRRVHVPLRAGYAHYGDFHFVTVGGELQVRAYKGLFIQAGATGYMARYCGAPDKSYQGPTQDPTVCGKPGMIIKPVTLVPLNLGFTYRFGEKRAQPYAGADLVAASLGRLPRPTDGAPVQAFAVGGRARLGVDIFLHRNFGINLDATVGFWSGWGWETLSEPGPQPKVGLLPHLSAGALVAF